MFDSNRPTAAQMRAMRADADRVRDQHYDEPAALAAIDDTALDLHGDGCTFCKGRLASRMSAVAS